MASLPPPVGEAVVRFDGTVCAYEGPATVPAGRMVVRFESTVHPAGAAIVHLVGDATIEEALAWVDANPASEALPPMVDEIDDVGPGETATVTVHEGHEVVVCGSEGSLVVATTLVITP